MSVKTLTKRPHTDAHLSLPRLKKISEIGAQEQVIICRGVQRHSVKFCKAVDVEIVQKLKRLWRKRLPLSKYGVVEAFNLHILNS